MLSPRWLPQRKTPDHVIDQLKAAVAADDMDAFQELLSGPQTHTTELYEVMREALAHDNVRAVSELLRRDRGSSLHYWDAGVAIAAHAKQCLTLFLDQGWDMNNTRGSIDMPSIFRYVPDHSVAGGT